MGQDPVRLTSVEREDRKLHVLSTLGMCLTACVLVALVGIVALTSVDAASKSDKVKPGMVIQVVSNCSPVGPLIAQAMGGVIGPCYGEVWQVLDVSKDGWVTYQTPSSETVWHEQLTGKAWREYVPEAAPTHGPVPPEPERFELGG